MWKISRVTGLVHVCTHSGRQQWVLNGNRDVVSRRSGSEKRPQRGGWSTKSIPKTDQILISLTFLLPRLISLWIRKEDSQLCLLRLWVPGVLRDYCAILGKLSLGYLDVKWMWWSCKGTWESLRKNRIISWSYCFVPKEIHFLVSRFINDFNALYSDLHHKTVLG